MEDLYKSIEAKLQLLTFTNGQTSDAVKKENFASVERLKTTLAKKVDEVHDLKVRVQELRFEEGDDGEEILKWSTDLEEKLSVFEKAIDNLGSKIKTFRSAALENEKKREEDEAAVIREKKFQEEMRFEKEKLEQKLKYEARIEENRKCQIKEQSINAKLPKLQITRFNGTHTDWLRFWNQFKAEIDSADVPQITKFSYLKELLEPRVRTTVDGLPFTIEGYERAKSILNTNYGKVSEIVNAYVNNVMSLPAIHGTNPNKIMEFYQKLSPNLQALETMGKLKEINGYVRMTLDKLEGIKGDLVRTDDNWQEWDFPKLLEALRKWTERNPPKLEDKYQQEKPTLPKPPRSRTYQANQQDPRRKPCVYCDNSSHQSINCDKVTTIQERRRLLNVKQLCFNCTGANHKASECRSTSTCRICKRRHHSSICEKTSQHQEHMLVATGRGAVIYPVVVVNVGGIHCRALLDTGAGSSYASAALLDRLRKQPVRKELKRIEMMMQATTREIEIHEVVVKSLSGAFQLRTEVTKVNRGVLLSLGNPGYKDMIGRYHHLKGVEMDDIDTKRDLPVHLILGASEYAQVKTETTPRIGKPGEPIAEWTRLGWTILSPGSEPNLTSMFLTQTSAVDYENLCRLDVLGLQDHSVGDQDLVYEEFKEQLLRDPEGWYETGLLWKGNHPPLPNNKPGSLKRLENLVKKLEKQPGMLEKYDEIIRDQLAQGIVERAEGEPEGNEFYIPHKPVVRETAESTKIRIVYDASARAYHQAPSLNDCLETGPPLQNKLWSVLTRNRFQPVALAGDLRQAFLQVRIREEDRDAMRFHWLRDLESKEVETLRFTRALFGMSTSPFLLGGVIEQHLNNLQHKYPDTVEEIRRSLYVDDLISGDKTIARAQHLKEMSQTIFREAKFELHKWHSNVTILERPEYREEGPEEQQSSQGCEAQTYAKDQLGVKGGETKLLGVRWNKATDKIQISFPEAIENVTKREVLGKLAKIYDPLGLASPITLEGKMLYRQACELRIPWDQELPRKQTASWKTWEGNLPEIIEAPRSIVQYQEEITSINLHAFGDASSQGLSAAVYAVSHQPSGISQGLVAAKSRLAKKGLTIPRLELVAGHMATNLVHNVKQALQGFSVTSVHCWLDSTVALHWIKGGGEYKQFVSNRVRKIQDKEYIHWRHVGSKENPADLGSRGGKAGECADLWFQGPSWLPYPENWPSDIVTSPSKETQAEAKVIKEVLAVAIADDKELDQLLQKWDLWRAVRICSWITRFIQNCKLKHQQKISGPLNTAEINRRIEFWVRDTQVRCLNTASFKEDQLRLNLQKNEDGLYECRGRIQGDYPIYLPESALFTKKLVMHLHTQTLHGGVGMTMAKVREKYWVPRLPRLTKQVIRGCHGCKRFQVAALPNPPTGNLPKERTAGSVPFKFIGVDFAGPIKYLSKTKKEMKAYIVLYACSLTRAVYLDLLPSQSTDEFLSSLKRFISRRGRPEKIFSDNGKTFVAAAKWLRNVMKDERLNDFLARQEITWQFNLSRAPWWGGQFERLIGVVKQSLYKSIGNGNLRWHELEEVILDVERIVNDRPLDYVEDDVQMPILTPSVMLFGQPNQLPEEDPSNMEDDSLRKRAKYLRRCKEVLWLRWKNEYLKSLRERHNLNQKTKETALTPGDVVLIKGEERNRGLWRIGVVDKLIPGRDGIVRAVRLRAGKSFLERPVQHLYPLELSCDRNTQEGTARLNARASEFQPRRAAVSARQRIAAIAEDELNEN
ncbi:uncharacterized protein [Montipora foliosa]|uniref:uncharacterized protein n=1 Tax=Montipora foliosa TaxID=591990 RepID=UPI0035F21561